ncbi:MAG: histidinol-phosphate transaminase [Clostridiaceae bacterium]
MSKFWSNRVKETQPYVYGEQPKDKKYIKLNTNENPYPPSEKVIEKIKNLDKEGLKLYPDPTCDILKEELSKAYNLKKNQIFIGNGSDEVLAFSFLAFFNENHKVIFPDISYSFYEVYGSFFKVNYKLSKLKEDFTINVEDYINKDAAVIIPNPNAPTSVYLDKQAIINIIESNPNNVVIIDEAYIDFGGESVVDLVDKYNNLLVIQTLSKSRSLAGLRVGFAFGSEELIEGLDRVKNSINSYTLDSIAIAAASEAIKDKEYFELTRNKIINTREQVVEYLCSIGFEVLPSKANFIFVAHNEIAGKELFEKLKEHGVLVRHFGKERIKNYLRVTIGSDEEMKVFCNEITKIIESYK